jgi:hypothetical protein
METFSNLDFEHLKIVCGSRLENSTDFAIRISYFLRGNRHPL